MNSLDRLRAEFPTAPFDARRIAATLEQPGCGRRTTLDAAHVHLNRLAEVLGAPAARQSPFAITRGKAFERLVMDSGMAVLLSVVRAELGMATTDVRQVDLSAEQVAATYGKGTSARRLALTRQRIMEMLAGDETAASLVRHPLFAITVAGVEQHVEADVLALVQGGRLHIIEIKSFQAIDGRPDAGKVAETALQSAVYVLAMEDLVQSMGLQATVVSPEVLLIIPRDFSFTAVGYRMNVRTRVSRLRRQLASLPSASSIADVLPADLRLPPLPGKGASPAQVEAARRIAGDVLAAIVPTFGDGCASCPLFRFCRDEARTAGSVVALGSAMAAEIGDIGMIDEALALARGDRAPHSPAESAVAETLSRALRAIRGTVGA